MKTWNEEQLRILFKRCADVQFHEVKTVKPDDKEQEGMLLVYCENLCDMRIIQELILPKLHEGLEMGTVSVEPGAMDWDAMFSAWFPEDATEQDVMDELFNGNLIVLKPGSGRLLYMQTSNRPERQPEESSTEMTVNGPRDAFIEDLGVNIALIRKRLRTNTLCVEKYTLGRRSRTRVALLYISDALDKTVARHISDKLQSIDIDSVLSQEELKILLVDENFSFFPHMNFTTRPDYVTKSLVKGRFAIMMDGLPTVMLAPVNISYLITVAEDNHTPVSMLFIQIWMRRAGLFITLLLPGFWVALTSYHQDQIPYPLLATIAVATSGTPLTGPLEILLMLLLFQFFLEAGSRLPSALGPSISVVGGLIIGDAIIKAGLTSPATLVIAAVSVTAQFTLVGGHLGLGIGLLRLFIFVLASFFGLFGFFTGAFYVLLYLANMRSFGVSFMSPMSPINWKDLWYVMFRLPRGRNKSNPELLHKQADMTGRRGSSEQ
ncbi:spore germination protein [Paenibacillus piri]|uniref:spore germination protein n=1 Tax=Paenibacillus piri TaxID=2547395 RepID=UPI0014048F0A|nr:spore germination protein [Paenibacillus piri]